MRDLSSGGLAGAGLEAQPGVLARATAWSIVVTIVPLSTRTCLRSSVTSGGASSDAIAWWSACTHRTMTGIVI